MKTSLQQYRQSFFLDFDNIQDADTYFFMLLEAYAEVTKVGFFANPERELSEEMLQKFQDAKARLLLHEPIQYILGFEWFYGRKFVVNRSVLIPRPETEELVDWIVEDWRKDNTIKIIDLCTGSGCIAISLERALNAEVVAIDISDDALAVAKENARILESETDFRYGNVLGTELPDGPFDVIVSNPPYVREAEKSEMQANVLDYEPHLALFVANNDALVFYRKILEYAVVQLKSTGFVYFEINQYLEKAMYDLAATYSFTVVSTRIDFRGNARMMKLTRI